MSRTAEFPRTWVQKNYSSFNGLRAVAIVLVFANHYGQLVWHDRFTRQLWFGVDLFFVLSGFLITGILYDSRTERDYFKTFYIRRALRIFPLYYGFFLFVLMLTPLLHLQFQRCFVWSNLLYLQNFAGIIPSRMNPTIFGIPFAHRSIHVGLGPLWSLCMEEHFYLLWPFLLKRLRTRQALMWFTGMAVPFTIALRILVYCANPAAAAKYNYIYFLTPTRWDNLFLGAWLALWMRGKKLTRRELRNTASFLCIGGLSLIALGEIAFRYWLGPTTLDVFMNTFGFSLVGVCAAGALIASLDETHPISRVLRKRYLASIGTISYGIYFFHSLPLEPLNFYGVLHGWGPRRLEAASFLVFGFVVALAALSYRIYESPFLRLKQRFAPSHRSVPSGTEQLVLR